MPCSIETASRRDEAVGAACAMRLAWLFVARAAAPWVTPCRDTLVEQLQSDGRANLAATACGARVQHRASSFWLIADRRRNVVLTGIPKAGISSLRAALNGRCAATEGVRCAEFRKNMGLRRMNVSNALRAVMFRDPFQRTLSLWRNLEELTRMGVVSRSFKKHNCTDPVNCSFADFVRVLAREPRGVGDEHQASQYAIARPDLMHYHFVGLLGNGTDEHTLYRDILGTAPVHVHASAHVEPDPAHLPKARRTIQHIYAKDYAMLRDFDLM